MMTLGYEPWRQWAASRWAGYWLLLWSYAEALIWFVLPDYLLLPMAMLTPTRWRQWWLWAWAASTLGMFTMAGLCWFHVDWVAGWLFQIPYTHAHMPERVAGAMADNGHLALLLQPFSGVPAKVWVYEITRQAANFPWLALLLISLGRGVRMGLVVVVGAWLGARFPQWIQTYWLCLLALYTAVFFYGLHLAAQP